MTGAVTSMLEKAARKLFESYAERAYPEGEDRSDAERVWEAGREGFIDSARSLLLAIREPDVDWIDKHDVQAHIHSFEAMIDTILGEKPA